MTKNGQFINSSSHGNFLYGGSREPFFTKKL
jgi:hypothetical protein